MNLLDCYVTEVLGDPYEAYSRWWVKVKYECEMHISKSEVMCSSYENALKVGVGYHFLA